MRLNISIIATLVWFMVFHVPSNAQRKIDYVKGGIPEARSMAQKEGKLFFAVFYTDWCLPCKWMDENSFAAKEVVDFVYDNYKAVRINIDEFDGHATRQQYNVEFLPTIIVFDQGGGILGKYEESLSSKRLFEALEKHRFDMEAKSIRLSSTPPAAVRLSDVEPKKEAPQVPPAEKAIDKPAPQKEPLSRPSASTAPSTQAAATDIPPMDHKRETRELDRQDQEKERKPAVAEKQEDKKMQSTAPAKNPEVPKSDETAVKPKETPPARAPEATSSDTYYSVQVGTFSRFENADKMRNEYRDIFGEGVHIKIENQGSETIYKVMIGRYRTYEMAEPLLALLRDQGMDGFIKSVKQ